MNIDGSVIIFTVFNVLILFLFLKKKLFVPVTDFMNKRTESIQNKIAEVEEMKKQAALIKAEYDKKLSDAAAEGKRIIEEYKFKAVNLSNEIMGEANKEAELIRLRAKSDAQRELEKADDEIKRQVIALALMAASKAVEGGLDDKKHHLLIKQFISKVGSKNG